jgi:hypothetical protein
MRNRRFNWSLVRAFLGLLALFICTVSANAQCPPTCPIQTNSWIGGTGVWSNPANWSLGLVPSAVPGVHINVDITAPNSNVTLDPAAAGRECPSFRWRWAAV